MFNFNFLSEYPLKFYNSNREINPNTEKLGEFENLTVSNQFGKIEFSGIVKFSNINYKDAIKIKKTEIAFSEEFIALNRTYLLNKNFITISLLKMEISANLTKDSIAQFIAFNNGKLLSFDSEGLVFILNELRSINFNNIEIEREISDGNSLYNSFVEKRFGAKSKRSVDLDYSISKKFKERDDDFNREIFDNLRSESLFFDEDKSKIDVDVEEDLIPEVTKMTVKNIDTKEMINPFDIKKLDNNFLKKNSKFLQNNFSCRVAFSHNGTFINIGEFNQEKFQYQLNINKITPNYSLLKPLLEKKNKNEMDVADMVNNINNSFYFNKNQNVSHISNKKEEEVTKVKQQGDNFHEKFVFSSIYYIKSFIKFFDMIYNVIKENKLVNNFSIKSSISNSEHVVKMDEDIKNIIKKYNISILGVPEFSRIIREYIKTLENSVTLQETDMENFSFDNHEKRVIDEKFSPIYKEKILNEINTLKLFEILFLNPFINKNNELQERQVNSLSEEFKKMRKKKLLEWLIQESNINYLEDIDKLRKDSSTNKIDLNHKEILINLVSGKLSLAVKKCNELNYSMLSQLILNIMNTSARNNFKTEMDSYIKFGMKDCTSENMLKILFLLEGRENSKIKSAIENNWERVLICYLIYFFHQGKDFSKIFKELEIMLKLSYLDNPNSIPFPKIKGKTKMKAIITDNHFNKEIKENVIERYSSFHFKLINFYATFDPECLKYLTRTSVLSDDYIDHHIQYIVITILQNTISETYKVNECVSEKIIYNLKKYQNNLFHKVLEELICYGLWDYAVKFILVSTMPDKIKKYLIKNIVGREMQNFDDEGEDTNFSSKIKEIENNEFLDIKNDIVESQGFYFYYKSKYEKALDKYLLCGNYYKAHELLCFKILPVKILIRNINNSDRTTLSELNMNSTQISNWMSIGYIFYLYIKYMDHVVNPSKHQKDRIIIEQQEDLLKRIYSLPEQDILMKSCKNVMLSEMRQKINRYLDIESNHEFVNVVIPNMSWLYNKNISLQVKRSEFNDSLASLIKFKSKVFAEMNNTKI